MAVLYCVGVCPNPWSADRKEEARRLTTVDPNNPTNYRNDFWAPGDDTWSAVYQTTTTIYELPSFSKFLGLISKQPTGSIHRINLFSHGNEGLIAFRSDIRPTATGVNVFLDIKSSLTMEVLSREAHYLDPNTIESSYRDAAVAFRNRFAHNAEIVFYLCHSGATGELLQEVANTFQVITRGFSDVVMCSPKVLTGGVIDRTWVSRDGTTKVQGFVKLTPDITKYPKPDKK